MALWMLYAAAVAALVAAAARAADVWAAWRGRPRRWLWACGLALAVMLPAAMLARPTGVPGAVDTGRVEVLATAAPGGAELAVGEPHPWRDTLGEVAAATRARLLRAGPGALALWVLMSAGLLVWLLAGALRLRRLRAGWTPAVVDGVSVLLSGNMGPAVVGVAAGRIVAPHWMLELPLEERRLLLAHEEEHLRARDPLLLTAALAAVVALPWNPAVWWLHRRLRLAVELDCDARVLRRHPDPARYGATLLEVGRRRTRMPLPAAAFAAPPSALEQRMRALLARGPRGRTRLLALPLAVAGLAAAWALPAPALQPPLAGTLTRSTALSDVPTQGTARFSYSTLGDSSGVARASRSTLRRAALPPGNIVVGSGAEAGVMFFAAEVGRDGAAPTRIPGTPEGAALALAAARAAAPSDADGGSRDAADAASLRALAATVSGGPVRWFIADADGALVDSGFGERDAALGFFAALGPLALVQAVGGEHVGAGADVTVLFARLR